MSTATQQQPTVTKAQISAGLNTLKALAAAIAELGEVPSGQLYASVMGVLDIQTYEKAIDMLVKTTRVTKQGHLLKWNGGAL